MLADIVDRSGGVIARHLPRLLGLMDTADTLQVKLILLTVRPVSLQLHPCLANSATCAL